MPTLLDPDQRHRVQTAHVTGLSAQLPAPAHPTARSDGLGVTLRINGAERRLSLAPRTTLLDARREEALLVDERGPHIKPLVLVGPRR